MADGSLSLSWPAATDNVGIAHYQIYVDDTPLAMVGGSVTQLTTLAFRHRGPSTFTIRALDAAGNQSVMQGTVTTYDVKRPVGAPKTIPTWAWKLLEWEAGGHTGTRPTSPSTLPGWYAPWKAWRLTPFRLA